MTGQPKERSLLVMQQPQWSFFLNVFTEFAERAQPETSYVRDQDAATVPAGHI